MKLKTKRNFEFVKSLLQEVFYMTNSEAERKTREIFNKVKNDNSKVVEDYLIELYEQKEKER